MAEENKRLAWPDWFKAQGSDYPKDLYKDSIKWRHCQILFGNVRIKGKASLVLPLSRHHPEISFILMMTTEKRSIWIRSSSTELGKTNGAALAHHQTGQYICSLSDRLPTTTISSHN
jgi:hypothetical protein